MALRAASLNTMVPAILNAISDESTSWYLPSIERRPDVDRGVAGEHARGHRLLDARRRPKGCTPSGCARRVILSTNS